jgi:hypothetical protein
MSDTTSTRPMAAGVPLAPGERLLLHERFRHGTGTFYLWTDLALTDRRLIAEKPNTVLGLIPVGVARASYPTDQIASVGVGTRYDVGLIIVGVLALIVGVGGLGQPDTGFLGWLVIAFGIAMFLGVPKQAVEIRSSAGGLIRVPVAVSERTRLTEFARQASEALTTSGKDPDTR